MDFCAAKDPVEGCVGWEYELNVEGVCNNIQKAIVTYRVPKVYCYLLPFSLVLFSLLVEAESDSLDDFVSVAFHLRKFHLPAEAEQILLNLNQLLTGHQRTRLIDALEFGYKMKFFQIISSDADFHSEDAKTKKSELFFLGSVQSWLSAELGRFCDEYVEQSLAQNYISIFNNWDALALLDSFTIRAFRPLTFQVDEWQYGYYRMIFIQSIFQKVYLQYLNQRFRAVLRGCGANNFNSLLQEFEQYERICQFNKISYTFLPLIIDDAIDTALEVKEERVMLTEYIKREQQRHNSENERLVNGLLGVISALASFSAIWDLACLLNEILPYEILFGCHRIGYAIVGVSMLLILSATLLVLFYRLRSRRRK